MYKNTLGYIWCIMERIQNKLYRKLQCVTESQQIRKLQLFEHILRSKEELLNTCLNLNTEDEREAK